MRRNLTGTLRILSGLWTLQGCAMSAVDNAVPLDGATEIEPSSGTDTDGTSLGDDGNADNGGFIPDDTVRDAGRDAQSATQTTPKPAEGDVDATVVRRDGGLPVRDAASPPQPLDAAEPSVPTSPTTPDAEIVDLPDSAPVVPPPPPPPPPPTCSAGTQLCGDTCLDLQTDTANCGSCGTSCGSNSCVAGVCTEPEPPPPPPPATPTAPDGCTAQSYGGHSYFFCATGLNWIDARAACRKQPMMDMTVIDDDAENAFVMGAGQTWVGASDIDGEGKWRALSPGVSSRSAGPLVSYTHWASGQPDDLLWCSGVRAIGNDCYLLGDVKTDEDCAVMQSSGLWEDVQCQLKAHNYVCESY